MSAHGICLLLLILVRCFTLFNGAALANPDVTNWDTSLVTDMRHLFNGVVLSDPDVSGWDISSVEQNFTGIFLGSNISTENYDAILNSWSTQTVQPNLSFHTLPATYCESGDARDDLINNHGWVVTDGGQDCSSQVLAQVLEDSASPGGSNNADSTPITVADLQAINGLVNIVANNESAYQAAIAVETGFSNPPTVGEVQTIVNAVNASNHFVITVDTTLTDLTPVGQYQIPSLNTNYQIQWEEIGNEAGNNSGGYVPVATANHTINFGASGIYRVMIDPMGATSGVNDFDDFRVVGAGDNDKLISVDQWGVTQWSHLDSAFRETPNFLGVTANDAPDLSQVTSFENMFLNTPSMVHAQGFSSWDTSNVLSMAGMFRQSPNVNPDVANWDMSKVTTIGLMFNQAVSANPDVSSWDTSSVVNMWGVFADTEVANPDVSAWDTSSVTNIVNMFFNTDAANPDVSAWDTSKVTNMSSD